MTYTQIKQAKEEGYSDEEILQYISKADKKKAAEFKSAQENGYSSSEILDHVSSKTKSWPQAIAESMPAQFALGLAKRVTFPADIAKISSMGASMEALEGLEPEEKASAMSKMKELYEYFPTQEAAEEFIKKQTGVDLSPQGAVGKVARGTGELYGFNPKGLLEGSAKEIGKRGLASTGGASISHGAKEIGVPEPIADVLGAGASGVAENIKNVPKVLSPSLFQAEKTAEKHGIRKFSGMAQETPPKITPKVTIAAEEKLRKELGDTTQKAINNIIEHNLPIKKLKDMGVNLEEAYTKSYSNTRQIASKIKEDINIDPVRKWITSEKEKIISKRVSPSDSDLAALKVLEREEKSYAGKNLNASQIVDQHIGNNENVSSLWRKVTSKPEEDAVKSVYSNINKKLVESAELAGHSDFTTSFKNANKMYGDTQNLKQAEAIFAKSFEKGYSQKALNKTLGGKANRKFLNDKFGKDSVEDLQNIAKYGELAEEKIFAQLKHPKTIGDYLTKMSPIKLAILLGSRGAIHSAAYSAAGPVGAGAATLAELGAKGAQHLQGWLFTRDATRKTYINFLKSASEGSKKALIIAAKDLEDAINKEFGSEDELIDFIKSENSNPSQSKR